MPHECACELAESCDFEPIDTYSLTHPIARKTWKCDECGRPIEPGEEYQRLRARFDQQDSIEVFRTCVGCQRLRGVMCWCVGGLAEAVEECFGTDITHKPEEDNRKEVVMECEFCGMDIRGVPEDAAPEERLCNICRVAYNERQDAIREDCEKKKRELRLRKPHWVRYNPGPDKSGYLLVVKIGQTAHNIADIIRVGKKWLIMRFGHTVPSESFSEREGFETLGAAKQAVANSIKEIAKAL